MNEAEIRDELVDGVLDEAVEFVKALSGKFDVRAFHPKVEDVSDGIHLNLSVHLRRIPDAR